MSLLTVSHLSHGFGEKTLYADTGFELYPGEHMGVVGQNGTGKSTLISILTGALLPDAGQVTWDHKARLGYLDQHAHTDGSITLNELMHSAFEGLYRTEDRMIELMQQLTGQGDDTLLRRIDACQRELEAADFYSLEPRIAKVAEGLGLSALGLDRPLSTLSGGQRAKAILAKLLLEAPDVLLLDEPTNFLDKEHVAWLAQYLRAFEGAFIVVSHDAEFLSQVAAVILDIEFTAMKKYSGGYEGFVRQKQEQRADYLRRYEAQQQEIARTQDYIARNKARASTANMAKSRQKRLDRMEKLAAPQLAPTPRFAFQAAIASPGRILQVKALSIGYGRPLLPPLSFSLAMGEKVVITGFNGIGKSTLLKTLMGELAPLGGGFTFAPELKTGYFQQDLAWDDPGLTPLALMAERFPTMAPKMLRSALARCGLRAQHALQPVGTLSGGEQSKVKLCPLTLRPAHLLVLDEPANHLDAETKECFQQALQGFSGAVILVSHEEGFYRAWADRVVEIKALGGERRVVKEDGLPRGKPPKGL